MTGLRLFIILLLLTLATAVTGATPPTNLDFLSSDPAMIAGLKAPNHDLALKEQLVLLNNNGGIPFYNMTTRRYQRIRQPANDQGNPMP